jgi:RNA polymerase sigma factor (sigma-70 family)
LPPFEQIVAAHGATVLRVCRALMDPQDADDAWSETFLAAMRAYPELPGDANVQAWLVTIAQRKVIDLYRASGRIPVPVDRIPERAADGVSEATDPTDPTADVWVAVRALPTKQREAIAYHYLGGLPYVEVAVLLGNSEAAARRAAADGMKTLRRTYVREQAS